MSKERARRRAEREREAAIRRAARAAEQERRERRAARRLRVGALTGRGRPTKVPGRPVGRPGGVLAQRRRRRTSMLVAALLCLNLLLWVVRPDWEARLAGLVLSVLAFPVLRLFVVDRR